MKLLDLVVAATVVGAVCFAPLVLGATHAWAFVPLEVAIFVIAAFCLARLWRLRLELPSFWRGRVGATVVPLLLFALWIGFEAVPLPPPMLRWIAPATYQLYQRVFAHWPEQSPFSAPTRPVSLRITSAATILPNAAEAAAGIVVPFQASGRGPGGLRSEAPGTFAIDALRWRSVSLAPASTRRAWLKLAAYTTLFLIISLFPFGGRKETQTADRDFTRLLFKAVVVIAMLEGLAGVWGSVSRNRMVLELLHPLEWSPLAWGARSTGTFANPDHFAFFLNLTLSTCLSGVIAPAAFVRCADRNAYRLLCATASLLVFSALLLSGSRAGWMSAALGVAFLIHLMRRAKPADAAEIRPRRWIGAGATVGLVMLASVIYVGGAGRGLVSARLATAAAEMSWRVTPAIDSLPMLARFPLFGVGPGAWPDLFRGYQRPPWSEMFYNATHNDGLQLLAETGIVGAGLFAMALGAAFLSWRRACASAAGDELVYLAAAAAPMPGAVLHELIDFSLQTPANAILLSALIGLMMRIAWKRLAVEARASGYTPVQKTTMTLGIVAAMGLAMIAAAQSRRIPHPHELRPTASFREARDALLRHPADSRAHLLMAEKARDAMDADLESQELRTTIFLEPSNPEARDRYAQVLARQGHLSAALQQISESSYYAPSFSAHAYLSRRRLIEWLPAAQRKAVLIGLNRATAEQFPGAVQALGAFDFLIGEFRASADAYVQAASVESDSSRRATWWVEAGRAFAAAGETDRSAAALGQAIRTDAVSDEAYEAMIALVLVPAGRFDQARRIVDQAIRSGAEPAGLYLALADAENSYSRHADAEADLRRGVEFDPKSFACLERLGRFYLEDKSYDEAVRWLQQAANLRPDSPDALFWLAVAQDGAYDYAGADASYARASAMAPNDTEFQARYRAFQQKLADSRRAPAQAQ